MSNNYGAFIINANGEESAHVHRTTSYIASLKNNWAYKNKSNMNMQILKNSVSVYHNSDFEEIMNKLEARFANTSSI